MFEEILLAEILGLPAIAYGGMASFVLISITLIMGIKRVPINTHKWFAIAASAFGLIHGIISIVAFI